MDRLDRLDQVGSHFKKWGQMLLTTDNQRREYNAHQKAGLITILLKGGSKMTTEGIARITGLSRDGAEYMMDMLSVVLPIVKIDCKWQWMDDDGV